MTRHLLSQRAPFAGSRFEICKANLNRNSGLIWDEATFREYIKDPKAKIPGTKMVYPGLKDDKRADDLIAYLKQFDAKGSKHQ